MPDTKKDILWRVYVVFIFFCLFGIAIISQVVNLQVVKGNYYRSLADSLFTKIEEIKPNRGNIFTNDGSMLATSVPIYDLHMDLSPDAVKQNVFDEGSDSLAHCLAEIFKDKSKNEYKLLLRQGRRDKERYLLIQNNVSYKNLLQVKTFPVFRLGRYKGGLIVEQKSKRQRPFQLLAERTVGITRENARPVGLEASFDKYLKGEKGQRVVQRISGNVYKPIDDNNAVDPQDGCDIITTIDLNIQDVAENALLKQLRDHDASRGCVVLMEVATGEVKAIANLKKGKDGEYHEDYNDAVGYSSEPGSTFKLATLIVAMEDGYVDLDDSVDTKGGVVYYGNTPMKDSHEGGYGIISVKRAFEVSSNVAISKILTKYYSRNPQAFLDRLCKMHLNKPLGLQINGETDPFIHNTKDKTWSKLSLPFNSIGYECKLTPLQTLSFYNAVANNGKMIKPIFVKEIRKKGQLIKSFKTEVLVDSICSRATIAKAKQMLEGVVERGTATNLKLNAYKIAGKTGTAKIASGNTGYKDSVRYQASFCGYFPAENPAYSCIVIIYDLTPKFYYGNVVAGPVFKEIADKVYATRLDMHKPLMQVDSSFFITGIPVPKSGQRGLTDKAVNELGLKNNVAQMQSQWINTKNSKGKIDAQEVNFKPGVVPNVIGMGLRDALYLLESKGLQVKVTGRGTVKKQSVNPGSVYTKGQQIIIELS